MVGVTRMGPVCVWDKLEVGGSLFISVKGEFVAEK